MGDDMKLGWEHVGKTLKMTWGQHTNTSKVLWVGKETVVRLEKGVEWASKHPDTFEVIEEPKMPSERIAELAACTNFPRDSAGRTLNAIIQYLDFEHLYVKWDKKQGDK